MTLTAKRLAEDEAAIRAALDSAGLPSSVVEYRLTLGEDWVGEPAAFIYFIMDDKMTEAAFLATARAVTRQVRDALDAAEYDARLVYPSFRTVSEQRELDAEAAKGRRRS